MNTETVNLPDGVVVKSDLPYSTYRGGPDGREYVVSVDSDEDGDLHVTVPTGVVCDASRLGKGSGGCTVDGEGRGDAYRTGPGNGSACRKGAGDGDVGRFGSGDGDAVRIGSGEGGATRDSTGDGNAHRFGDGKGTALRRGDGHGNAVRRGFGLGDARRLGKGDGDAVRLGAGHGDAERKGGGAGYAVRVGAGKGVASHYEGRGTALAKVANELSAWERFMHNAVTSDPEIERIEGAVEMLERARATARKAFEWLRNGIGADAMGELLESAPDLGREMAREPGKRTGPGEALMRALRERLDNVVLDAWTQGMNRHADPAWQAQRELRLDALIADVTGRAGEEAARALAQGANGEDAERLAGDCADRTMRDARLQMVGLTALFASEPDLWVEPGEGRTLEEIMRDAVRSRLLEAAFLEMTELHAGAGDAAAAAAPS